MTFLQQSTQNSALDFTLTAFLPTAGIVFAPLASMSTAVHPLQAPAPAPALATVAVTEVGVFFYAGVFAGVAGAAAFFLQAYSAYLQSRSYSS